MRWQSTRSPQTFFFLVFALSVPFWVVGPVMEKSLSLEVPVGLPASALQFVTPLIATSILVYRVDRQAGVKRVLQGAFDFKRIERSIWYFPIFLLMPLSMALAFGLMHLWGTPLLDTRVPFLMIPVFFVLFFVPAMCEEIGWQGYIYDPVAKVWGPLRAAVILGVIWAVWHVVPNIQQDRSLIWILEQGIYTVALRVLIVWIYIGAGKSVFAASTFHAMSNVSVFLFPNYGSHYDPLAAAAVIVVITLLVMAVRRTHQE